MVGRRSPQFLSLRRFARFAPVPLALCLLVPAGAEAATTGAGPLTPELAKLGTSAVAAKPPVGQAKAIGLPAEGPGSLVREGGRVVVEARFEAGAVARVEALKAAGAKVLLASRAYQAVALSVEPEDLRAIGAVPGVSAVVPSRRPVFYGPEGGAVTAATGSGTNCEGGSVISQGLSQLNVPAARQAFGARGAGETIGVLSDSFDTATESVVGGPLPTHAYQDELTNDLPGPAGNCAGQKVPVRVIAEGPGEGTDEGRAMLQVIHDLAPHAELAFATAYSTELQFAENIKRLAAPVAAGGAGANVIVDDVGYFAEPFFQDGPVAVAIDEVTEAGVTYLTAAGNDNLIEAGTGNEIASWEAPEYRAAACPAAVAALAKPPPSCMDFAPSGAADPTFGMTVEAGATLIVDLQWAEPWYGVATDLDAYLLDGEGHVVSEYEVGEGTQDNLVTEVPMEFLEWENTTSSSEQVFLTIGRCSGTCNPEASAVATPRLKFALLENGRGVSATEYPRSEGEDTVGPTIYGHAGSAAAITLGAVNWGQGAEPAEPERYSSRGPVTHYFGPVKNTTPAEPETEEIEKPNLTATDCASTTFFARPSGGAYSFCGTSEAAPHAAAVAALMQQGNAGATPAEITEAMESSATEFTTVEPPAAVGAGLLNAAAAMTEVGDAWVYDLPTAPEEPAEPEEEPVPTPTPTPTPAPTPAPTPHPGTAPAVTITKGPSPLGNDRWPTFEFDSSQPASFTCALDGGGPVSCSSPYTVPYRLADGDHGFVVTATDTEGRSGSSGVYGFKVDTRAPRTWIVGHPRKVVRTRKFRARVHFRLRSNQSPVTFYCQYDREALRVCPASFHHRFTPGRHMLRVRARDQAGNIATRRAIFRFRVKQIPRGGRIHPRHARQRPARAR